MIDVHIYGVHARDDMIRATVEKLGIPLENIHYDDRTNGGSILYTAKKAWLASVSSGVTHRIVLQDDVQVCNDFLTIAEKIAEAHSADIIGFFPYEFMEKNSEIEGLDTPYFRTRILSGCGIMMPIEYIQPCFDYIAATFEDACPDDWGIQAWADNQGIRTLTTIPALIQHIGDESISCKGCPVRRTVYFNESPQAHWGDSSVAVYHLHEWFFSNHGKRKTTKGVVKFES